MEFGASECVEHWARYSPDVVAAWSNGGSITYRRLNQWVDAYAAQLEDDDLPAGRVALLTEQRLEFLVALLALLRLGRTVVILNPQIAREIIAQLAEESKVNGVIASPALSATASGLRGNCRVWTLRITDLNTSTSTDLPTSRLAQPREPAKPDSEWGILYSSGSTGIPKGILRDHYSIMVETVGWVLDGSVRTHG